VSISEWQAVRVIRETNRSIPVDIVDDYSFVPNQEGSDYLLTDAGLALGETNGF